MQKINELNGLKHIINNKKVLLPKSVIFNVVGPIVTIPELSMIGLILEDQAKFNEQLCDLLETLIVFEKQ